MAAETRTVRLVREESVLVDGECCSSLCLKLQGGPWRARNGRYFCGLTGDMRTFIGIRTERLSPYRPIRCAACVEGEVKP